MTLDYLTIFRMSFQESVHCWVGVLWSRKFGFQFKNPQSWIEWHAQYRILRSIRRSTAQLHSCRWKKAAAITPWANCNFFVLPVPCYGDRTCLMCLNSSQLIEIRGDRMIFWWHQESGGLLLLDEDENATFFAKKTIPTVTSGIPLRGNQRFGCRNWSNDSEGWAGDGTGILFSIFCKKNKCLLLFSILHCSLFQTSLLFAIFQRHRQVIRSDFNCTIITIAHRIQTLFLGCRIVQSIWFCGSWGWTMTKLQSLKVEKWLNLTPPRTPTEKSRTLFSTCEAHVSGLFKVCQELMKKESKFQSLAKEGGAMWIAEPRWQWHGADWTLDRLPHSAVLSLQKTLKPGMRQNFRFERCSASILAIFTASIWVALWQYQSVCLVWGMKHSIKSNERWDLHYCGGPRGLTHKCFDWLDSGWEKWSSSCLRCNNLQAPNAKLWCNLLLTQAVSVLIFGCVHFDYEHAPSLCATVQCIHCMGLQGTLCQLFCSVPWLCHQHSMAKGKSLGNACGARFQIRDANACSLPKQDLRSGNGTFHRPRHFKVACVVFPSTQSTLSPVEAFLAKPLVNQIVDRHCRMWVENAFGVWV